MIKKDLPLTNEDLMKKFVDHNTSIYDVVVCAQKLARGILMGDDRFANHNLDEDTTTIRYVIEYMQNKMSREEFDEILKMEI